MRKAISAATLLAELDRREAELADIEARFVDLRSRYQSVWDALSNDKPLSKARKPKKKRKQRPRLPANMEVNPKDVDLTGTNTSFEKLVRIAEVAPNQEVNLSLAIRLLITLGVIPQSKFNSTRTTLHNAVRKRDSGFRRIRPGWYQYSPSNVKEVPPVQWLAGEIDYAGSPNIGQKLVRMAKHTVDGRLEPQQTARRLIQDGESSQRLDSLGRLVRQSLRRNASFRELKDEWFELAGFSPRSESQAPFGQVEDVEPDTVPSRGVSGPYMGANGSMNGNIPDQP